MGEGLHEIRTCRRVGEGDVMDSSLAALTVMYVKGAGVLSIDLQ